MANDLRLSAVVDDKFSAPLKKLQDQLKQVGSREHIQRFKDQETAFKHTNEAVVKLTDTMRGGLAPVMANIGLASVGLSGGLGAIIDQALKTGDKLTNLSRLSASISLKPQNILNDQALLANYGIDADKTNAALKTFSTNIFELQHRQGALHQTLATEGGAIGQAEDARLQALKGNLQAQLEEYLSWLNKIKSAKLRAHYAAAATGDEDVGLVGTVNAAALQKQIAESKANSEKVTDDAIAAALRYQKESNKIGQAISSGWDEVAHHVLDALTTVLDESSKALEKMTAAAKRDENKYKVPDSKHFPNRISDLGPMAESVLKFFSDEDASAARVQAGQEPSKLDRFNAWVAKKAKEAEKKINAPVGGTPSGIIDQMRYNAQQPQNTFTPSVSGLGDWLRRWLGPEQAEGAELPTGRKPISLLRADDEDIGNRPNALGAARNLEISSDAKEKVTALQRDINSSATLSSLKDISLDAERRIAEWWRKGIIKGMADIESQSPTANADGAAAEALYNPSGAAASRTGGGGGGGGGDGKNPYVYNPSFGAGNLTKLITESAQKAGIDPRIMEGIRAGESGHSKNYDKKDDAQESSWGPFQLNRRRGLGVEFERDTAAERAKLGFGDLHDPRTIPMQADWVAQYIKRHGGTNGQWMGYRGPRDADARWGDSGYNPPEGAAASALPSGHGLTSDYGNLHTYAPEATAGGPAEAGLIALAHHVQDSEGGAANATFHALHDRAHVFGNPSSFHNRGLAFDVSFGSGGYEAARQRLRAYLAGKGMTEGDMSGRSGEFAIEPGTGNHLHAQFNSEAAAERYLAMVAPAATGAYAIGDSIAKRVQMATGMPGMGVVGASPAEILKRINALPNGALAGKQVLLSGGASNNIGQTGMTEQEIEALKAKGAKAADIMLLGVGDRADFQAAKVNDRLRKIAKDTGVAFEAIGETADRVHPTIARAKAIADHLKTPHIDRAIGAQTSMRPGDGAGANGRMDVHFHGVPSHMRTTTKIAGDLFTKVHINRGAMMPTATG